MAEIDVRLLLSRLNPNEPRQAHEMLASALHEYRMRLEREKQARPGGLYSFIEYFWDTIEPGRQLVDGWPLRAMCLHLEAVTYGYITRLLVNVSPGSMKSLLLNCFWPAWEWSAAGKPGMRYISFSYSALLTERDNQRMLDLIESQKFQELWGHMFNMRQKGVTKISNSKFGWKFASSVRGTGTGERADRVLLDDPHSIKESESKTIREETVRWFREAMSNRLNHMTKSAILIICQRAHEDDVSGTILSDDLGYEHLMIPMLYERGRHCSTSIGWSDPRTEEGENFWPERFPPQAVEECLKLGDHAFASQYQQRPSPRGGGIFKNEYWNIWEPDDGRYPNFDFILASVDPAYTHHDENDPSAMTIWGVNYADDGTPRVFLIAAWRKWLQLHGPTLTREYGEPADLFLERQKKEWGLVEWIGHSCKRFQVDHLLIESKASGISVMQEMQRLLFQEKFGIEFVDPGRADKEVRANRVQHIFSAGMIYRPDRPWATMVEDEMAAFPKARYDDLCLVGETLITTKRGDVCLSSVTTNDYVLTPIGWRRVLWSGQTGVAPVITRQGLTGTPNHPIFDIDSGFVRLDTVTYASRLSRISLCDLIPTIHQKSLFLMKEHTNLWVVKENTILSNQKQEKELKVFMSLFGNSILEKLFRKGSKLIISMPILLISALIILSAYQKVRIEGYLKSMVLNAKGNISQKYDLWRQSGIVLQRVASGIGNTLSSLFKNRVWLENRQNLSESIAAIGVGKSSIGKTSETLYAQSSAIEKRPIFREGERNTLAKSIDVIGVGQNLRENEREIPCVLLNVNMISTESQNEGLELLTRSIYPVYNLEVEGAHCYYANGVLVHNCDSATYALWWLRQHNMLTRREELKAANDPKTGKNTSGYQDSVPLYPM